MKNRQSSRESSGRRESSQRRERSSGSSKKFEEGLPISNKKQILGFFFIVFSLLIMLSIVSYSASDESLFENVTKGNLRQVFTDIFQKQNQNANYNTSNWLGIIGVLISGFFVRGAFGYFSVVIPVIFIIFGLQMMRKKSLASTLQLSAYMIMLMVSVSAFFGVLRTTLGVDKIPYTLVGTSGEYFASIFYLLLGGMGSLILLTGLIIAFSFLMIDRDIAASFARLKLMIESFRDKFRTSMEEMKAKREEERLRESQREAIQKEREQILKSRNGKKKYEETIEEPAIKDTKINRPAENEMIKDERTKALDDIIKEPQIEEKEIPFEDEDA